MQPGRRSPSPVIRGQRASLRPRPHSRAGPEPWQARSVGQVAVARMTRDYHGITGRSLASHATPPASPTCREYAANKSVWSRINGIDLHLLSHTMQAEAEQGSQASKPSSHLLRLQLHCRRASRSSAMCRSLCPPPEP